MSFFGGMPFPVQFFLAFVIVLGLIGATAWAVRRFGTGRIGGGATRGRQPRLAVIDYATVDARRRLILVRRDNIEHLVMIGGPTDIVVESNIVRAAAAPREASVARPMAAPEPLPRPVPSPESVGGGSWPLAPEPVAVSAMPRALRNEPISDETPSFALQPQSEQPARPQRESLAALADELSTRQTAPPRNRPQGTARSQPAELRQEVRQDTRMDARPEMHPDTHAEPRGEPASAQQPAVETVSAAVDESIAEMAHQLEIALRKPSAKTDRSETRGTPVLRQLPRADSAPAADAASPTPTPTNPAPPQPVRASRSAEGKPQREGKTPNSGKSLYDSLEQEMATLLGRPTASN